MSIILCKRSYTPLNLPKWVAVYSQTNLIIVSQLQMCFPAQSFHYFFVFPSISSRIDDDVNVLLLFFFSVLNPIYDINFHRRNAILASPTLENDRARKRECLTLQFLCLPSFAARRSPYTLYEQ